MSGTLITVEGSDGAGKTTQLDLIEAYLHQRCIDLVRTREPGGTPVGEKLRGILLEGRHLNISNETELLLIFAARQQHIDEVIRPALRAGRWVLCDRFTDASYAYQGAGRGIAMERIAVLEEWVQGGLCPDLTLVLDVDVEEGMRRSVSRNPGTEPDRFEQQDLEFKQAVRRCYLDRAEADPDRIRVINAAAAIADVDRQVKQILKSFLTRRTGRGSADDR